MSVHQQIAGKLRIRLAGRQQAGARFSSQNELAREFGVSPNTAREAVALLVQEGLLERRTGSGTYQTGSRPRQCVGLVSELDLSNPATSPFFMHLMQSLRGRFEEAGYETRVYIGHTAPFAGAKKPDRITSPEFYVDLAAGGLLGVVNVGCPPELLDKALASHNLPIIRGEGIGDRNFIDFLELVRMGVKCLSQHGCRCVACMDLVPLGASSVRLDTFYAEAARLGMSTYPEWNCAAQYRHERGDAVEAFKKMWLAHEGEHPDGLLVLDDMLYRDLAPMLLLNGIRVPQDLVVVSHANSRDKRPVVPSPIRLAVDSEDLAKVIVRHMINILVDRNAPVEGLPIPIRIEEPATQEHMLLQPCAAGGRCGPQRKWATVAV